MTFTSSSGCSRSSTPPDLDRRSYVVAVGGGAVLDAVGFAAAIAHRGIRLVRLPTTTLAQADSGVGVKNGGQPLRQEELAGRLRRPLGGVQRRRPARNPARSRLHLRVRRGREGRPAQVPGRLRPPLPRRRVDPESRPRRGPADDPRLGRDAPGATSPSDGDPFEALEARPLELRPLVGPQAGADDRLPPPPRRGRRHRRGASTRSIPPSHSASRADATRPHPGAAWSTSASTSATRPLRRPGPSSTALRSSASTSAAGSP